MSNKSKLNIKIFLLLTIVICQVSAGISVNIERQGRRVEIDGFLLEWNRQDAREWGSSSWTWDAINTAEGVAGYFASQNAPPCSSWTFTINTDNKTLEIKVPEQTATGFFAFDRGSFENEGIYTIEWLVPWNLIENENALSINAANVCGDALETLRLSIIRENSPSAQKTNYILVIIVLIVIIVAVYIYSHLTSKSKSNMEGTPPLRGVP